MVKPPLRYLALTVGAATLLSVSVALANASTGSAVLGLQTVPTYSYSTAIRESVWVQTDLDNDHDGVGDKIAVDVIRPREAADSHLPVPVIMQTSPYYACCGGRGNDQEFKEYDSHGTITKMPLYYDNYFVPRGYAVVAADLAGTSRSTGCVDVGGPEDVLGAKAVVDWLNGRAKAAYVDGTPAVATQWTNGKIGMIGMSWDGSIANAVAATAVPGLRTIVPIAGISRWYDYTRFNGVRRGVDYMRAVSRLVTSRPPEACSASFDQLAAGGDDATGDFNAFWAERDYQSNAGRVQASVFLVHGINDSNVTTTQFAQWWSRLRVPKKLWLSQMAHVDPFDIRRADWVQTLHRWFDFYLQDLPNGIDQEPPVSLQTGPGTWVDQATWPAAGARPVELNLGDGNGTTGTLGATQTSGERSWPDRPELTEADAITNPTTAVAGRAVFLSAPLSSPVRLSGTPHATLRVQVDKPTTELSLRLVDYGAAARIDYLNGGGVLTRLESKSCWGEEVPADDACYYDTVEQVVTSDQAVLTRGWQDAAHYRSLQARTPLKPDTWYEIEVPMQPTDQTVAAGHVLGLVLQQSDPENSAPTSTGATIRVDLRGSSLTLPLVDNSTLPAPAAGTAPHVRTAPIVPRQGRTPLLRPQSWRRD